MSVVKSQTSLVCIASYFCALMISGTAHAVPLSLLITNTGAGADSVERFDGTTGEPFPAPGRTAANYAVGSGLSEPKGIAMGPDGNVYVADNDKIKRFQGPAEVLPGQPLAADGPGANFVVGFGMGGVTGLAFGGDGNIYVSNPSNNSILRFQGPLSASAGTGGYFTGGFGLSDPQGLTFDRGGYLYVADGGGDRVKKFDGTTGVHIGNFASGFGLDFPTGVTFGPDGNLYVASFLNDRVLRFDGMSGAFIDNFIPFQQGGLDGPVGLAFGPDGNLYVANTGTLGIKRYNGTSGDFIDNFAQGYGIVAPQYLVFAAAPEPGILLLFGGGLAGMLFASRRRPFRQYAGRKAV